MLTWGRVETTARGRRARTARGNARVASRSRAAPTGWTRTPSPTYRRFGPSPESTTTWVSNPWAAKWVAKPVCLFERDVKQGAAPVPVASLHLRDVGESIPMGMEEPQQPPGLLPVHLVGVDAEGPYTQKHRARTPHLLGDPENSLAAIREQGDAFADDTDPARFHGVHCVVVECMTRGHKDGWSEATLPQEPHPFPDPGADDLRRFPGKFSPAGHRVRPGKRAGIGVEMVQPVESNRPPQRLPLACHPPETGVRRTYAESRIAVVRNDGRDRPYPLGADPFRETGQAGGITRLAQIVQAQEVPRGSRRSVTHSLP
ncbi:MAG: hypothetical protein H6Q84_1848 [Deltaproteobacteria bacterium]|nr:hypothetical protein [Deltaproteobacteria bacterium]